MADISNEKVIMRIRNRSSYKMFQRIYGFLQAKPDIEDILQKFYDVLDSYRSFDSRRNAVYAHESLMQVCRDNGIRQNDESLEQGKR